KARLKNRKALEEDAAKCAKLTDLFSRGQTQVATGKERHSPNDKQRNYSANVALVTVFYDWINTKIKSITQLSKPSLKEQNNGSDLHHYKHMSTSHFLRNNTHK